MENLVLFSPLGMTDPTRDNYDGAFLHILRHYKPHKAYLFMTSEVCNFDEKDDRYEAVAKKLFPECSIVKLRHPEIERPNDFELFHSLFDEILKAIQEENPDAEIIVNASSGTPQMKSSLYLLCAGSETRIKAIQVSTPAEKANRSQTVGADYDVEGEWENLIDNLPEFQTNRCSEVKVDNVRAIVSKEIISDQIKTNDYRAALEPAKKVRPFMEDNGERLFNLLHAGAYRLALDFEKAQEYARKARYGLFPVDDKDAKPIYEYIMYLTIKKNRGELADFTRGVSPVITDLFESYLKKQCGENMSRYYEYDKAKSLNKLIGSKMPPDLKEHYDTCFPDGFKDGYISGANLLPFIEYRKGKDSDAAKLAKKLRDFERTARNDAAHAIVSITEEKLKKQTGMDSSEILKSLKDFFEMTYPDYPRDRLWGSYNDLNREIVTELFGQASPN